MLLPPSPHPFSSASYAPEAQRLGPSLASPALSLYDKDSHLSPTTRNHHVASSSPLKQNSDHLHTDKNPTSFISKPFAKGLQVGRAPGAVEPNSSLGYHRAIPPTFTEFQLLSTSSNTKQVSGSLELEIVLTRVESMSDIQPGQIEPPIREFMSSYHGLEMKSSPNANSKQTTSSWRHQLELDLASIETGTVPNQFNLKVVGTKLDEQRVRTIGRDILKVPEEVNGVFMAFGEVEAAALGNSTSISSDPVRKGALSLSQPNDLPTASTPVIESHTTSIHHGVGSLIPITGVTPRGLLQKLGRCGRKLDKVSYEREAELDFKLPDHMVADEARFSLMTVMKEVVGAQEKAGLSSDVFQFVSSFLGFPYFNRYRQ